MKKLRKKVLSLILAFAIMVPLMTSGNVFAAEDTSQGKNIINTYEASYVLSKLDRDGRFLEEINYFSSKNIDLKNNLHSIYKYDDNSYRVSYVVENGDEFVELVYNIDSSFKILLEDKCYTAQ